MRRPASGKERSTPDLGGRIDAHVHARPEHIPRRLDVIDLAREARDAGMAGLIVKSHTCLTADRAQLAMRVGCESSVLAMDMGQVGNPSPVKALGSTYGPAPRQDSASARSGAWAGKTSRRGWSGSRHHCEALSAARAAWFAGSNSSAARNSCAADPVSPCLRRTRPRL